MNYKNLIFLFLILNLQNVYAQVKEISDIDRFFTLLSRNLEGAVQVSPSENFDNHWEGSSDLNREISFKNHVGQKTCIHLRKTKISVFISHKDEACVSNVGYTKSFVNYSIRKVSEKLSDEINLLALEFNASSKFYFLPLLKLKNKEMAKYQKWSHPDSQGIVPGVLFLE